MIWKNTSQQYGLITKILHWVVAMIVIGLLGLGLYMARLDFSPFMLTLYFWHKSFGITVLGLMIIRLLWRHTNKQPDPLSSHKIWERKLAHTVHIFFYTALIIMPLAGWTMSSAKGFSVSVFGWFTLPDPVGESKLLAALAGRVHQLTAYILISIIALHIAGALKHHFIDKDGTIRRMTRGFMCFIVVCIVPFCAVAEESGLPVWIIDPEQSSITFEATQMGAKFEGEFKTFKGDIVFDPERLSESHAIVIVDIASVTTQSSDRDKYIVMPPWLNAESFPESSFIAYEFRKDKENQYIALGELRIRDFTLELEIPFTLQFDLDEQNQDIVAMESSFVINRLDYGVGQGEWRDTKMVGNPVTVRVTLIAARQYPRVP